MNRNACRSLPAMLCGGFFAVVAVGCGREAPDRQLLELRERLVVAKPPAAENVRSLSQLMDSLASPNAEAAAESSGRAPDATDPPADDAALVEATDSTPATVDGADTVNVPFTETEKPTWVIGRIHAGDFEPWETGQAAFLISEVPDEGHGKGHDVDNCPFCKRKAAQAPKGMVRFLDAEGQPIPIDARKLFGVEKNDIVVIYGAVAVGELNTLMIDASGLHVLR